MLPPVALHVLHLDLPVLVPDVNGGLTGAIAVEAWKYWDRIINIKLCNFSIKVVNFFPFIIVIEGFWAIVGKPAQFRRVHKGGNSHCIGNIGVLNLANVQDGAGKLLEPVHHIVPAVAEQQVSSASDHHNIHRAGKGGIIQPESMVQVRDKPSLNSDIVHVEVAPPVPWAREVLVEDVRHNNLDSVIRGVVVGLVADHAGRTKILCS